MGNYPAEKGMFSRHSKTASKPRWWSSEKLLPVSTLVGYVASVAMLRSLDAAKLWIIKEHRGRRNLTEERDSYLRGTQHDLEKRLAHRPEENGAKMTPMRTRERIAAEHRVSPKTIERDAKFARNVDAIASAAGEAAKNSILDRGVRIARQEVALVLRSWLASTRLDFGVCDLA